MIRIRNSRGEILPLEEGAATVELCSSDGKIARLFLVASDRVIVLDASDDRFTAFCRAVGCMTSDTVKLV